MSRPQTKKEQNLAFIDGQNLFLGTTKSQKSWRVDLKKFRIFLCDKYHTERAYYFLGCVDDRNQALYDEIQEAGFVLKFREHNTAMLGKKKGNVDTDIVFDIMKRLYKKESFDKIVLVSGDGDYKKMVDFLIAEERFKKILFPNNKHYSSLYKKLGSEYFDFLDERSIKRKIKK